MESWDSMMKNRNATVAVIGLGYIGLPLAVEFAKAQFNVLGFDIDRNKIEKLSRGRSYLRYVTSDTISHLVETNHFQPLPDFSKLNLADAILVCVPTPLKADNTPDLSSVLDSTRIITRYLRKGQLVVLESTTYPGTTQELIPILESEGLKVGKDFFLAYSPERIDPGNYDINYSQVPKLVSGITEDCLFLANTLYEQIFSKTVMVSSTNVAEAAKLLENVYRSVNVALVNELKVVFERIGLDIWEVIEAASTKPFGFKPFYPGPGLGGHCVPIDPFYLAWKARCSEISTRFIELAGEINTKMPFYVISKIDDGLKKFNKTVRGSNILILGVAYKKDIDDTRESPSLKIISILKEEGANVEYNDPYVPYLSGFRKYPNLKMESKPLTNRFMNKFDCVVIVTDHSCYDWQKLASGSNLIIDTRNATRHVRGCKHKIIRA